MVCYDMTWYVMMTYDRFFENYFFFKIVWPCWGYVWVSWLVILRPSKNWKKMKILFFSKVVYWPLGYYLASSLIIFSPEIIFFENLTKIKDCFSHVFPQPWLAIGVLTVRKDIGEPWWLWLGEPVPPATGNWFPQPLEPSSPNRFNVASVAWCCLMLFKVVCFMLSDVAYTLIHAADSL